MSSRLNSCDRQGAKGAKELRCVLRVLGVFAVKTRQRWSSGFFTELIVPREYYLGRIAEAGGDRAAAREHYARFVRWWRDCDPELKPMWEDGRQRLASVGGEPQKP